MLVSIIVCTHSLERYYDLVAGIDSLRKQSYLGIETVIVVDHNEPLFKLLTDVKDAGGFPTEVLVHNTVIKGLPASRNVGVYTSKGEVVAFLDDDALADKNWVAELVRMYVDFGATSAGGMIKPYWGAVQRPDFLPDEYLWLIGATHKGFREDIGTVRNTFGSNMSFLKNKIDIVGGFKTEFGFSGSGLLQGEEADMCSRIHLLTGKMMMYNPGAVVYHKVFPERIKLKTLIKRLFYQGYSKRMMEESKVAALSDESGFLKFMLLTSVPDYTYKPLLKLVVMLLFTTVVFVGYCYRLVKSYV